MANSQRNYIDLPCSDKCRSLQHGNDLRCIASDKTDEEVVCVLMQTCNNYCNVKDSGGRTALHLAASHGRVQMSEWLIKKEGSSMINAKDAESGYTPLHRSLYFGNINVARCLIKLGADLSIRDYEGLNPLDLLLTERTKQTFELDNSPTEVYIWGANDNFNLGTGQDQPKFNPEVNTNFGALSNQICDIKFQKFHTVFLTQQGSIFVCGHGKGGVLGTGNESAVLTPLKRSYGCGKTQRVIQIATSVDHTVLLLEDGTVLSCGSNESAVLGINPTPTENVLRPKAVSCPISVTGVDASRLHTVFYNAKKLYMCGTNQGQMGFSSESGTKVFKPEMITFQNKRTEEATEIKATDCNESTTAVLTHSKSDNCCVVYLFNNFGCFKVKLGELDFMKIMVTGGTMHSHTSERLPRAGGETDIPVTVFFTRPNGSLCTWRENICGKTKKSKGMCNLKGEGYFTRLAFNLGRNISVKDFCVSQTSICFVTAYGEAYKCKFNMANGPVLAEFGLDRTQRQAEGDYKFQSSRKGKGLPMETKIELIKAKRIPHIFSAVRIKTDGQGINYAVIQRSPREGLTYLPFVPELITMEGDLTELLLEASVDDSVHDVIFEIKGEEVAAHRFIIANMCPKLDNLIAEVAKKKGVGVPVVKIDDVPAYIFRQFLVFIYSNSCDILNSEKGTFSFNTFTSTDGISMCSEFAKRLNLNSLRSVLRGLELRENSVYYKDGFSLGSFPQITFRNTALRSKFCDATLKFDDSILVQVNLCMLVARIPFFRSMFSSHWQLMPAGDSNMKKPIQIPFSSDVGQVLVEYMYDDSHCPTLAELENDKLLEAVKMADHYLLDKMTALIEVELAFRINIKNVVDLLQFADYYNSVQLKICCFEFISINISHLLENKMLDQLSSTLIDDLTNFYKENTPNVQARSPKSVSYNYSYQEAVECTSPEMLDLLRNIDTNDIVASLKKPIAKNSKVKLRARTVSENSDDGFNNSGSLSSKVDQYERSHGELRNTSHFDLVKDIHKKGIVPKNDDSKTTPLKDIQVKSKDRDTLSYQDFPSLMDEWVKPSENLTLDDQPCCSKTIRSMPFTPIQVNNANATHLSAAVSKNKVPLSTSTPSKKKTKWKSFVASKPITNESQTIMVAEPHVNPWTKSWENNTTPSEEPKVFEEIVQEEQDKKNNLRKAVSKSINDVLKEEAAMNVLKEMYTTQDVVDNVELLVIERVAPENYAQPTWVPGSSR